MPEHVAVALRPPKSAAAVPDISECTPVTAATISSAATPTTNGSEKRFIAITAAIMSMNAQKIAAGGPRRDWKNLSEISPPANPPTMPNMHSSSPQLLDDELRAGLLHLVAQRSYTIA